MLSTVSFMAVAMQCAASLVAISDDLFKNRKICARVEQVSSRYGVTIKICTCDLHQTNRIATTFCLYLFDDA